MPKRVVVINAVALGPETASRYKRLEPGSNVILTDQNSLISFGG